MVKQYVQLPENKNTNEQFQVLRPAIEKIVFKNMLLIAIATGLVIGALTFLNTVVGLDVFIDIFTMFGIEINTGQLVFYGSISIAVISLIMILISYLSMNRVRYEVYQDRITAVQSSLLIMTSTTEIQYQNIVKLTYSKEGIINSVLNTGSVIIELTGMQNDKFEMEFIDNPEQVIQYLQQVLNQYRALQQAEFDQNYKIDGIVNRL